MTASCAHGVDAGFQTLGYTKVVVLGVIQGITELLPVSSTAHMRVVPALLGWRDPGSAFSAVVQLAALAAVVSYFWKDVQRLATQSITAAKQQRFDDPSLRLTMWIAFATAPFVLAGVALSPILNQCDSPLRGLSVIGWACIGMAVLLAITELVASHRRTLDHVSLLDTMTVGLAQVGAFLPGVSRSGSTLTAALALGFERQEAARLSFLLGIPAIALAGLREIWALYQAHLDANGWSVLAVGFLVASVSAFTAIWALMRILERFSAWPFVVYRGLFGIGLLVGVYLGWLT
jgi:undecaprenyl-diphosphatase